MTLQAMIELTRDKGPMTAKQIAAELGLQISGINTSIRRARRDGSDLLRIARWAWNIPKYAPGPGEDAPFDGVSGQILSHLELTGNATASEIATELGLSREIVESSIYRLHQGASLHIGDWKSARGNKGGRKAAVYVFGKGRDVPRPDRTFSKRDERRQARKKQKVLAVMARNQASRIFRQRDVPQIEQE